jgi:hypothetical protein
LGSQGGTLDLKEKGGGARRVLKRQGGRGREGREVSLASQLAAGPEQGRLRACARVCVRLGCGYYGMARAAAHDLAGPPRCIRAQISTPEPPAHPPRPTPQPHALQ